MEGKITAPNTMPDMLEAQNHLLCVYSKFVDILERNSVRTKWIQKVDYKSIVN